MIDRKQLKRDARDAMRETRPRPIWVALAVIFILCVTQGLSFAVSGEYDALRAVTEAMRNGETTSLMDVAVTTTTGRFASVITFALDLMTSVISAGFGLYALRLIRRAAPSFGDVFDAFGRFLRVVCVGLVRGFMVSAAVMLYAFVMALLLSAGLDAVYAPLAALPSLAPLVIILLGYSLADFLAVDEAEYGVFQCLALSRMAMRGHMIERLKLELSFIGWYAACLFPPAALWVYPYVTATRAAYYDKRVPQFLEEARRNPRVPTPPPPKYHAPGDDDWDWDDDDF